MLSLKIREMSGGQHINVKEDSVDRNSWRLTGVEQVLDENVGGVFTSHGPSLQEGKAALHHCNNS